MNPAFVGFTHIRYSNLSTFSSPGADSLSVADRLCEIHSLPCWQWGDPEGPPVGKIHTSYLTLSDFESQHDPQKISFRKFPYSKTIGQPATRQERKSSRSFSLFTDEKK
ncbi:hypothetical protein AVEN_45031-1 [Araneus ventricosus]|uniref:Uncharacterized protein n=1 Tax=Araneus ventricosus TaxID=182803 RepID=A0A4Y2QCB2_ARAVE|nr:hypothetical protein AVEN_45031-1 [Araneus ventricosus]